MAGAQAETRNIVLIGYRGCGKSTVGRLLAERLGWQHIDTDQLLRQRLNRSIAEVFSCEGERFFREVESEVIAELAPAQPAVISVGAGAVVSEHNRKRLCGLGCIVWLRASVPELHRRITSDQESASTRPPLSDADPLAEINATLAARASYYEQLAEVRIDTTDVPPERVATMILQQLQS